MKTLIASVIALVPPDAGQPAAATVQAKPAAAKKAAPAKAPPPRRPPPPRSLQPPRALCRCAGAGAATAVAASALSPEELAWPTACTPAASPASWAQ
jgi:hypothetical protein